MVAEITGGYRSMRHDSRGRPTGEMAPFLQLWDRSKTSNRGGVREEKGRRSRCRGPRNRPRQISGREFVTSCFPRATEAELGIRVHAFPEREREKAPSRRNAIRMEGEKEARWRERDDFSLILRIQRPEAKTMVDRSFPGRR